MSKDTLGTGASDSPRPYMSPASFVAIRGAGKLKPPDLIDALDDVANAMRGAIDAIRFALDHLVSQGGTAHDLGSSLIDAIFVFQAEAGIE